MIDSKGAEKKEMPKEAEDFNPKNPTKAEKVGVHHDFEHVSLGEIGKKSEKEAPAHREELLKAADYKEEKGAKEEKKASAGIHK